MSAAGKPGSGSLRGWAHLEGFSGNGESPPDAEPLQEAIERAADREELLSEAMRIAGVGGWELDLVTQTLSWSDETFRIFGIEPGWQQPSNELFYSLVQEDDRARMLSQQNFSYETGRIFDEEYRIIRPDGELRYLNSRAQIVPRGRERANRFLGIVRDITTEKLLEQKLDEERKAAQRAQADLIHVSRVNAMGTMASAMAHELSQPLASILNYAAGLQRCLKEMVDSESAALAAARDIEKAAARASVIIKRLRTMASKGELQLQAVPLEECVREAAEMALTGAYLDIRILIPLHLHVLADRVQLQQVFVNLIRNAVEAIDRDGGEIEIVARADEGNVQVSVSDNGPGIGEAAIETIFEPFVSTKAGGMGIGLSISRTIIEAFGGRLDVKPGPAGGATFVVVLLAVG